MQASEEAEKEQSKRGSGEGAMQAREWRRSNASEGSNSDKRGAPTSKGEGSKEERCKL